MSYIEVPEDDYDYREHLQPTGNDQVDITVYVNSRGTMSPIKSLGFEPLNLSVHQNYHMLDPKGKALFRTNAYKAYLDENKS